MPSVFISPQGPATNAFFVAVRPLGKVYENSFPKGKFGSATVKEAKDGVTVTYGYDIPKTYYFSATGTQYLLLQFPHSPSKLVIKESITLSGAPARDKVMKEFSSAKCPITSKKCRF